MGLSLSTIGLLAPYLLGTLANEIKTAINSDLFNIPIETQLDQIQSPAIFLDNYSHFTQCPALDNLVKPDAYCFNAVPVNTAFTDKVNHMIKEHPERIIYKDKAEDFIIYHSKHASMVSYYPPLKLISKNGSTVSHDNPLRLINKCYKDRYHEVPEFSIDAERWHREGNEVVCRHYSFGFLKLGKDFQRVFSRKSSIQKNADLMENRFDHEKILFKAHTYHFFSHGLFGKSLSAICRQMQPGEVKKLMLLTISDDVGDDHAMALEMTEEKGMVIIKFFNNHEIASYRQIIAKDAAAIECLTIEHILGGKRTRFYFGTDREGNTKTDGIILEFVGEITYFNSLAVIPQKIDLSCWQNSARIPRPLKNFFSNTLKYKAEALASESAADITLNYPLLKEWIESYLTALSPYLNSPLPEIQKTAVAELDDYFKYIHKLTLGLDSYLTPDENSFIATKLSVSLQPFMDSPLLSMEQKIMALDKGLAGTRLVDNEGVNMWFQIITKSSLPNTDKKQLLQHIANLNLPAARKDFLQTLLEPWLTSIS